MPFVLTFGADYLLCSGQKQEERTHTMGFPALASPCDEYKSQPHEHRMIATLLLSICFTNSCILLDPPVHWTIHTPKSQPPPSPPACALFSCGPLPTPPFYINTISSRLTVVFMSLPLVISVLSHAHIALSGIHLHPFRLPYHPGGLLLPFFDIC